MSDDTISRYFDWAATSPADEEILTSALNESIRCFANPSAVHTQGAEARRLFEEARKRSADALGVKKEQIFFTSGGTEADHIPLLSLFNKPEKGQIILSGIEHPALREQCDMLKKCGFEVITVNPDKNGFITTQSIVEKITSRTQYITVMAVNNETGCVQNIYELSDAITKATEGKRRPHFHVDCVQAAGKIPLNLSYKGIDSAALSAHKICGPRGTGILYLAREIKPFLIGGGQESGVRSGTENLFGAIAFSKCLEKYLIKENSQELKTQTENTKNFIAEISKLKGCSIVPAMRSDLSDEVQSHFSSFVLQAAFHGIPGNVMVRALDSKGFSISTGSACSAKKQSRPILAAMNASRDIQDTAVRFSFGPYTTKEGMDQLLQAIQEIVKDFN